MVSVNVSYTLYVFHHLIHNSLAHIAMIIYVDVSPWHVHVKCFEHAIIVTHMWSDGIPVAKDVIR